MFEHHALVYAGSSLSDVALPVELLTPNADIVHLEVKRFSIDLARTLVADALIRPLVAPVRTFICAASEWPVETQNALLKLLEEPPAHAQFILIVPRPYDLLSTLQSRVQIVDTSSLVALTADTFSFFKKSYAERFDHIATLAKNQDSAGLEEVMRTIEKYAASDPQQHFSLLRAVVEARQYFSRSGSSKKMLLEHLTLLLPPPEECVKMATTQP